MEEKNYITGALTLLCIILCIVFFLQIKPPHRYVTVDNGFSAEPPPSPGLQEEREVFVHLCGQIRRPGVYKLPAGGKVCDALILAGGLTGKADAGSVNMARNIRDGEQIYIEAVENTPEKRHNKEKASPAEKYGKSEPAAALPASEQRRPAAGAVDINSAGAPELERIPGIGPKTAEKIIAHRTEYGNFTCWEEIAAIPGIKKKTLDKCRNYILIEGQPPDVSGVLQQFR